MKQKAFTLIELLAVIVILAVVLGITVPSISNLINASQMEVYKTNEQMLTKAVKTYFMIKGDVNFLDANDFTVIDLSELQSENIIGNIPDVKNKNINCTGKVFVLNNGSTQNYYPSLKCGSNYETSTDFVLRNNAVNSVSHVYNSSTNDYTISIDLARKGNARKLITPTSEINIVKPSLIDYNVWTLNTTGSQGPFSVNGIATENQIILKENPWGQQDVTWATLANDTASNADGGWAITGIPIDRTKKYRLSIWIRREDVGDGRTYFGTQGTVANLGTETLNTNPYFRSYVINDLPIMANHWLLWIAHIYPSGYNGTTDPLSGIYDINGNKLTSSTDYKWVDNAIYGGHRVFLYYSTAVNEKQFFYRPRMEVIDGAEPTIDELLKGNENGNIYDINSVNTNGIVNYTVSSKGTYNFSVLINDYQYKFSYIVD